MSEMSDMVDEYFERLSESFIEDDEPEGNKIKMSKPKRIVRKFPLVRMKFKKLGVDNWEESK